VIVSKLSGPVEELVRWAQEEFTNDNYSEVWLNLHQTRVHSNLLRWLQPKTTILLQNALQTVQFDINVRTRYLCERSECN